MPKSEDWIEEVSAEDGFPDRLGWLPVVISEWDTEYQEDLYQWLTTDAAALSKIISLLKSALEEEKDVEDS